MPSPITITPIIGHQSPSSPHQKSQRQVLLSLTIEIFSMRMCRTHTAKKANSTMLQPLALNLLAVVLASSMLSTKASFVPSYTSLEPRTYRPSTFQFAVPRPDGVDGWKEQALSYLLPVDTKRSPLTPTRRRPSPASTSLLPAIVLAATSVTGASAASAVVTASGGAAATATAMDPLLEAEVLNDLAHISLDLFTVLGPARLVARLATIVGRVFAIASDYVPDHKVLPEEVVFQAIMMAVACFGLFQALLPLALASLVPADTMLRDGKVFTSVFEPAGMTWSQFKAMRALCADWIQVEPGHVICVEPCETCPNDTSNDDDNYIYWLYRGHAEILSVNDGKLLCRVMTETGRANRKQRAMSGQRFLGATQLLTTLSSKAPPDQSGFIATVTKVVSTEEDGDVGATLLRIHAGKLKILIQSDPDLADSMRIIAFSSLRDKYLAAQHRVIEQHNHRQQEAPSS
jgi:hypothetical protein